MSNKIVYAVGSFAAIGGLVFGFDVGNISGVLQMESFRDYFAGKGKDFDPNVKGTVVSILTAGCFFGALLAGFFTERLGRKWTIFLGAMIFNFGATLQCAATSLSMLMAGRFFAGYGVGKLSMSVPLYQSEISPKEVRGRLVATQQLAITLGIALSFWINYACSETLTGNHMWRTALGIQLMPGLFLALGIIFMPYSPRWLMNRDRDEEAIRVLARVYSKGDITSPVVDREYSEMKESISFERANKVKDWKELFRGSIRRRLMIGISIQVFQQLTGINSIMYYAPAMFEQAGLTGTSAQLLATGIQGIINFLATIPAVLFIDRWGRRLTLISGAAIVAFSMLCVGFILAAHSNVIVSGEGISSLEVTSQGASYASIFFIYLFIVGFAYSWGPCGWIYPSEIFPLRIRSEAVSITSSANWLFNFAVAQLSPLIMSKITWGIYLIFGFMGIIMGVSVFLFYPETKGRSLEEMDEIFESSALQVKWKGKPVKA